MIRPDIATAVREGWDWAEEADLSAWPDALDDVCEEARDRYTRIPRQRAFVKAARAALIHRN